MLQERTQTGSLCYKKEHKLEVYAPIKRHFQLEMVLVANGLIFLQKKYRRRTKTLHTQTKLQLDILPLFLLK